MEDKNKSSFFNMLECRESERGLKGSQMLFYLFFLNHILQPDFCLVTLYNNHNFLLQFLHFCGKSLIFIPLLVLNAAINI